MIVKLGTFESFLASLDKVIATWLLCEKEVFGAHYPQSHNSLSTLQRVLCKCNHTYCTQLQNHLVLFLKRELLTKFLFKQ